MIVEIKCKMNVQDMVMDKIKNWKDIKKDMPRTTLNGE